MRSVLSTRRLTAPQKVLLLNAGLSIVDYDAIKISALDFQFPKEIENAIFSSSNAVDIVFKNDPNRVSIGRVFAVGEKTSQKLKELGQNVVKTVNYSSELVDFLNFSYKNIFDENEETLLIIYHIYLFVTSCGCRFPLFVEREFRFRIERLKGEGKRRNVCDKLSLETFFTVDYII